MWKAINGYSKYMVSAQGEIMRVETQKILKTRPRRRKEDEKRKR